MLKGHISSQNDPIWVLNRLALAQSEWPFEFVGSIVTLLAEYIRMMLRKGEKRNMCILYNPPQMISSPDKESSQLVKSNQFDASSISSFVYHISIR